MRFSALVFALVALSSSPLKVVASSTPIMAQYWPAYNSETQPPSQVPFSYADLAYYFVTTTTSSGFELGGGQAESDISTFVSLAKSNGSKPVFTVGGWDGSIYFSHMVGSEANRTAFATEIQTFLEKWEFEGVDIDWEYPNGEGIGCNTISTSDSANLLLFLKTLRSTIGSSKLITAAVSTSGFLGDDGTTPLDDFSAYATYLDYLNLMTYDVSGSWSPTTGPNAPLRTCSSDTSVEAAVKLWTSRGFPAEKILLGIPSYAISFTTSSSTLAKTSINEKWTSYLYQEWDSVVPEGAPGDSNASTTDVCGTTTATYSGQWQYKDLIANGLLSSNGSTGLNGFKRRFDSCSQTPFLFNPDKKQLIAYDDGKSASVKAAWAKSKGLAGVMIFDSTGFTDDVLASIRSSLLSRKTRRHDIFDIYA